MPTYTETVALRESPLLQTLLWIWEHSVRATHTFLSEEDFKALTPLVMQALMHIETLCLAVDEGAPCGFMGVENGKIEMLFIAPELRGRGIGKMLVNHATQILGVDLVDVNEQNTQAVGFYTHLGFTIVGHSPTDDQGRPYPLLHMRYTR